MSIDYRPEIDGLRAVAVLSIVIFHLKPELLQGGFVGVDIFFAISGYLITAGIGRDFSSCRFSLLSFYQRRIARIFPALLLVLLGTLAGSFFTYSEMDFASAASTSVFAILSVVNFKLLFQGDYFHLSRDAQPMLHYWSLSVEEQFYLVYPVALQLVAKWDQRAKIRLLATAAVVSLAACIVATKTAPVAAFYLLPTRAWEFLAGCILAVRDDDTFSRPEGVSIFRPVLATFGLFAIGASFIAFKEDAGFPGYQAALPVLGTLCVIGARTGREGLAGQILSSPPIVLLGKMSYSLYLLHWPIFSLVDYRLYLSSTTIRIALKICLTTAATLLTFYLVEKPSRQFLNLPQNRRISFTFLALAALCLVPVGTFLRKTYYVNSEYARVLRGGITINERGKTGSIVLVGDSQGSMYGRMFSEVARFHDYRLTVLSVAGSDPLPPTKTARDSLWDAANRIVKVEQPNILIIACDWAGKLRADRTRLNVALDSVRPYVGHIILLSQPPLLPQGATRAGIRESGYRPFFEDPDERDERRDMAAFLNTLADEKVAVVDVEQYFVSQKTGEVLFLDNQGRELFQDSGHLSGVGATRVREGLEPILLKFTVPGRNGRHVDFIPQQKK